MDLSLERETTSLIRHSVPIKNTSPSYPGRVGSPPPPSYSTRMLSLLLLSLPAALSIPLSEFDLQKRPHNYYVTANAVHVKHANRSITVDGTTIPYAEAFPPFKTAARGTVLILTEYPSLLFAGRPSLFQMITATGHRTILPYVAPPNLPAIIKQAEMHHTVLVSFPSSENSFFTGFEGVVLIDPAEDSNLPPPTMPTVLLYTHSRTADQGWGDDWSSTRVESISYRTLDLSDSDKTGREKFAQILANFLDRVHVR
ncbi:hypothetical protein PENTCL1PPCAC_13014 [Pristionchus entomophagus]|uniref:Uncharacterized protein n=1 Tax=Pristionchus entomophagus TaxID=358040 RepID=A0AAV5TAQ8_9BILA|nr:hypothetical protein PENTCL1PPCAC_13014 [Pristionchus entomophagus]